MQKRPDIPSSAVPGSSRKSIALEWLARLIAVGAIVLFLLTLGLIERGKIVQASADRIVDDFRTANTFFDERADFTAPTTAREQLETLEGTLDRLSDQTVTNVDLLAATAPDVETLLASVEQDVAIAERLERNAVTLRGHAGDLRQVARDADGTVQRIDGELARAMHLVEQLNVELAEIERKIGSNGETN